MIRRNIEPLKHFVTVTDLSIDHINQLIHRALDYKRGATYQFLEPKFAVNLFFDDSTRTRYGLEIAEKKLGIDLLNFDAEMSQAAKGESLYDTVLTMSALGVDVAAIRFNEKSFYDQLIASDNIDCAIINAGDGIGEHPIQAMTNIMTIYEHFGKLSDLTIGIIGDVTESRVVHSMVYLCQKLGITVKYYAPKKWLKQANIHHGHCLHEEDLLKTSDIIWVQRFKRHTDINATEYYQHYCLTVAKQQLMKDNAIILHDGPVNRQVELDGQLYEHSQSKILTQVKNSVYMTMAILEAVLTND